MPGIVTPFETRLQRCRREGVDIRTEFAHGVVWRETGETLIDWPEWTSADADRALDAVNKAYRQGFADG